MGYLALLGLVLSGAGTLASILGIFFWYICQRVEKAVIQTVDHRHQTLY